MPLKSYIGKEPVGVEFTAPTVLRQMLETEMIAAGAGTNLAVVWNVPSGKRWHVNTIHCVGSWNANGSAVQVQVTYNRLLRHGTYATPPFFRVASEATAAATVETRYYTFAPGLDYCRVTGGTYNTDTNALPDLWLDPWDQVQVNAFNCGVDETLHVFMHYDEVSV